MISWEKDPNWRDGRDGKEGTPPAWMVITKQPKHFGGLPCWSGGSEYLALDREVKEQAA